MLSNLEFWAAIIAAAISVAAAVAAGVMKARSLSKAELPRRQMSTPLAENSDILATEISPPQSKPVSQVAGNRFYGPVAFAKPGRLSDNVPSTPVSALFALITQENVFGPHEEKGEWVDIPYRLLEAKQKYLKIVPEGSRGRLARNLTTQSV